MKYSFLALGAALVSVPALAHHEHIVSGVGYFTSPMALIVLALAAMFGLGCLTRSMKKVLLGSGVLLAATPALAHHPLGGMPMETFTQGLLSGVGHPILGFDHLFFIALVGIVAVFTCKRYVAPAAYIGAMLVGCLLMYAGVALPAKEVFIGLSLLVLGGLALSGRTPALVPVIGLFALFGLFHGSAFGDSIAAQEGGAGMAVLVGYLIGLGAVQYLIALGSGWITENVWKASNAAAMQPRIAGAMVAGVGLFLTLENIEGPLLAAIF